MMNCNTFYSVVVLNIDIFETTIVNEKHFASRSQAGLYANEMKSLGYIIVIAQL